MKGFIEVTIMYVFPSKKRLDEGVKPTKGKGAKVLISLNNLFEVFDNVDYATIGVAMPDGDYVGWKTKETYEEIKQKIEEAME